MRWDLPLVYYYCFISVSHYFLYYFCSLPFVSIFVARPFCSYDSVNILATTSDLPLRMWWRAASCAFPWSIIVYFRRKITGTILTSVRGCVGYWCRLFSFLHVFLPHVLHLALRTHVYMCVHLGEQFLTSPLWVCWDVFHAVYAVICFVPCSCSWLICKWMQSLAFWSLYTSLRSSLTSTCGCDGGDTCLIVADLFDASCVRRRSFV